MTPDKNLIAIHFSAYVFTNYGETVAILGNCPQLGMWDPTKGYKLQTNPKEYPIWFSKNPIVLQQLTSIEFKIAVLKPDGNIARWQNLKLNRTLSLKTSCSVFLTEGEIEAEYEQENEDSTSTKINSTKKGDLSQIEEESDEDEFTNQNIDLEPASEERKRSGSSGRPHPFQANRQQKIHSSTFMEDKTQKYQ